MSENDDIARFIETSFNGPALQPDTVSTAVAALRRHPLRVQSGAHAFELEGVTAEMSASIDRFLSKPPLMPHPCPAANSQAFLKRSEIVALGGEGCNLYNPAASTVEDVSLSRSGTRSLWISCTGPLKELKSHCLSLTLIASGTKRDLVRRLHSFCSKRGLAEVPKTDNAKKEPLSYSKYVTGHSIGDASDALPSEACVTVLVDTRERAHGSGHEGICALFAECSQPTRSVMMPLGDIAFTIASNNSDSNPFVLPILIERKCLTDLCSSITQPRYNTQKAALRATSIASRIYYLIEGKRSTSFSDADAARCDTASLTVTESDGFTCLRSSSARESAQLVSSLAKEARRRVHAEYRTSMEDTLKRVFAVESVYRLDEWQALLQHEVTSRSALSTFPRMLSVLRCVSSEVAAVLALEFHCPMTLFQRCVSGELDQARLKARRHLAGTTSRRTLHAHTTPTGGSVQCSSNHFHSTISMCEP